MLNRLKKYVVTSALVMGAVYSQSVMSLTFVIDFNDLLQPNTQTTVFNAATNTASEVTTFDVTSFGFLSGDFPVVASRILAEIENDYHNISGIMPGHELDIDFVFGDIGSLPSNGDSDYYFMQVGTEAGSGGPLGFACYACAVSIPGNLTTVAAGSVVGTIFSDNIQGLGGVGAALSSGDIDATAHALAGTISHEIGHTLGLEHVSIAVPTPNGLNPLMATGAIDLPNAARLVDREFSNDHILELIDAVGLRAVATSGNVPLPATWLLMVVGLFFATRKRSLMR